MNECGELPETGKDEKIESPERITKVPASTLILT